jgi:hypothetical protein
MYGSKAALVAFDKITAIFIIIAAALGGNIYSKLKGARRK